MPSLTVPAIPHYQPAPPTNEALDYADLAIIDLSKASTTEGCAQLASQVREAMSNMEHMFDIADIPFSQVSDEEKEKYVAPTKQTGSYQGYKLRQYWHIDSGDQVENYNIHRDVNRRAHPEILRPLLPEISLFARHSHENILYPILRYLGICAQVGRVDAKRISSYHPRRLMALGLELPEDTLLNMHRWDSESEQYVRFMKYFPRSADNEEKTGQIWLKGHTDIGTITILYSQPVAALQILARDGTWKWIKHIENAIVVNAGDALEFLSGGSTAPPFIGGVIQPPKDQRGFTRLGIFYFCMTDDDIRLAPLTSSPVLQRIGIKRRFVRDEEAPLMRDWRKARTSAYGQTTLLKSDKERGVEEEIISGVVVIRHYN
ncbi:hypothetical protein D9757_005664 [Collybiopsis confluens]|uniref:Isopenicillin N synthase-like Fe(2+) 2OG dioxygenase domain-containing protein n=1 Tax=Collybiopsis confluens TaxID=2823264 RepID=A0A8H5HSR5_9AGAR|nr:hypothetical protein D9757_005664 [Collybiopsis confluens]